MKAACNQCPVQFKALYKIKSFSLRGNMRQNIVFRKMSIVTMLLVGATVFSSLLFLISSVPRVVEAEPIRVAYSITEKKSSTSSSYREGPTVALKQQLPIAESTLPHAPVLREMSESEQHDMSTSTPSSESLESQLQSPHIVRKKALEDFDTSAAADDLLQTMELVQ